MPVAVVGGLVAAGLWGAWVTKNVLSSADLPPMAKVQLAGVVGEYVRAQARSATPPEQVTAETRAFMAEIQRSLEARGQRGQVVLVGEAVLAGNVPDITAELRREVYAKVRMPRAAAADAGDVMGAMRAAMATPQSMAQVPAGNPLHAPGQLSHPSRLRARRAAIARAGWRSACWAQVLPQVPRSPNGATNTRC